MLVALMGNQNSGKTTLFNLLSKSKQKVGNFPGVTVESKTALIGEGIELIDLPGTYSLDYISLDEKIASSIVLSNEVDLIVNVIDVNVLKRSLYLTLELLELNKPLIIALNMIDEFQDSGNEIDTKKLCEMLGHQVFTISASKGINIDELEEYIRSFEPQATSKSSPKYTKGHASLRYKRIDRIMSLILLKPIKQNKKLEKSIKIDKILLNKYLAYPIFFTIMFLIFFLTFGFLGESINNAFNHLLTQIMSLIKRFFIGLDINQLLFSLIVEGIFLGITSVVSFMPSIILLFFFLSMLEDSGYLARIAILMDKPLKRLNLNGKSFVPYLLGFGCTVPAVLASKTLQGEKEKKRVITSVSFMSCSAKAPIYMMISSMFFKEKAYIVCILLYLIGVLFSIVWLSISKKKTIKSEFILEVPPYRFPSIRNCAVLVINKCKDFIRKTFSIIFICSILLWFLTHFNNNLLICEDINDSLLADFSKAISVIFTPLGFADWRISASLISGISAKESFISSMGILFNGDNKILLDILTPLGAFSLLIFILFYTPCFAAQASISKELNSKRKGILVGLAHFLLAYILAFFTYQIGALFL